MSLAGSFSLVSFVGSFLSFSSAACAVFPKLKVGVAVVTTVGAVLVEDEPKLNVGLALLLVPNVKPDVSDCFVSGANLNAGAGGSGIENVDSSCFSVSFVVPNEKEGILLLPALEELPKTNDLFCAGCSSSCSS